MRNKIKIRIFLWFVFTLVVFWFFHMGVVPGGEIVYVNDFSSPSEFVQKLSPSERVQAPNQGTQKIIGNPVYFSLHTPRSFDWARLSIRYKNDFSLPLIEVGALVDKTVWRYDLQPLENSFLDELGKTWSLVHDQDYSFFQKEKTFDTLDSFLANIKSLDKIAVYHYDLQADYKIVDYASSTKGQAIENFQVLQGAWQALTYVDNEDMNFEFDFFDKNQNDDEDLVEIFLYYKNQLIHSEILADKEGDRAEENFSSKINIPNLPSGVYKIEVKTNDDVLTNNIVSTQKKLAFLNRIELAKNTQEDVEIFTDSQEVSLTTVYPDRLGSFSLGSSTVEIDETYRQFSAPVKKASSSDKLAKLMIQDGFILGGSGVFAFSQEAYFNPRIKKAVRPFISKDQGIEYVIAKYESPQIKNGWKTKSQVIDLKAAYREDNKYSFLISIPDLSLEDESYVEIDEIKVELRGRSLMEKIQSVIKKQ